MRLLFLTLEFSAGTFSGNGQLAKSQVRSLTDLGHEVLVICGTPPGHREPASREGAVDVIQEELPIWGVLDASCAWREFAQGAAAPAAAARVASFRPHAVLGVDFHSAPAYELLLPAITRGLMEAIQECTGREGDEGRGGKEAGQGGAGGGGQRPAPPPFLFLNYRVHLRTAPPERAMEVGRLERRAVQCSAAAVFLSRSDVAYAREHLSGGGATQLHVLLPPLRADLQCWPLPADVAGASAETAAAGAAGEEAGPPPLRPERHYLLCCVRLSPEKEPARFVDLAAELSRRGALRALRVTPVVAGAGWDSPHGAQLACRLEREVPEAEVLRDFMGGAELAELYGRTALNFHPPLYDAYGMTVVEAASQGAPSLVHGGGHVGSTDLLREEAGEVICADLSCPIAQLADLVEGLLSDRPRLLAVGAAAAAKARGWGERDAALALAGLVQAAVAGEPPGRGTPERV